MARGRPKLPPSEQELAFQEAFKKWEDSNYQDKEAWDIMFFRVIEVCLAIGKKIIKGVNCPQLEDRCMDAAIYFMERIKRDKIHPNKLVNWCYLGVKGFIYKPIYQREDREISLEGYLETHADEFYYDANL